MPSTTSCPSKKISAHTFKRTAPLKHNLRENLNWLFALSLIFLMLEPFIIYLLGGNKPAEHNYFLDLNVHYRNSNVFLLINLALAAVSLFAVAFLAYRLFNFLFTKAGSNFNFSLPLTRQELFLNHYMAGFILILASFILEILAMLFVFFLPPQSLLEFFQPWFWQKIEFILSVLAYYNVFVLAAVITGDFKDCLNLVFSLQALLPLSILLMRIFAAASLTENIEIFATPYVQILCSASPALNMFMASGTGNQCLIELVIVVLGLFLNLAVFYHRPAERAGQRLEDLKIKPLFEFFWAFSIGMLGGMFIESLVGVKRINIFLLGYLVFAGLALLFFQILASKKFHFTKKAYMTSLVLALAVMLVLDLGVELWPNRLRAYSPEDIEAVNLNLWDFGASWNINEEGSEPRFVVERENDASTLEEIFELYRDSESYAVRRGFFRKDLSEWDFYQQGAADGRPAYVPGTYSMVFQGREDTLMHTLYYPQDYYQLADIIKANPHYAPVLDLGIDAFQLIDYGKDKFAILLQPNLVQQESKNLQKSLNGASNLQFTLSNRGGISSLRAELSTAQATELLQALARDGYELDYQKDVFSEYKQPQRNREILEDKYFSEAIAPYAKLAGLEKAENLSVYLLRYRELELPGLSLEVYPQDSTGHASEVVRQEFASFRLYQSLCLNSETLEQTRQAFKGLWEESQHE